ncbi:MAG: hypothetical protein MZU97_17680 [Bacillus subtilis]|nr:hypothetical protein [Bacillus subtilis]
MDFRTITTKQYSLMDVSTSFVVGDSIKQNPKVYTYPEMIETAEFSDLKYPTELVFSAMTSDWQLKTL